MPRKRALGRIPLLSLLSILILGAVIAGCSKLADYLSVIPADFRTTISGVLVSSLGIILTGVYTMIEVRRLRRDRAREAVTRKARIATEEHLDSLVRKREQLVKNDAYGKQSVDKWTEQITHFVAQYVRPTLTRRERSELDNDQADIVGIIDIRVQVERDENAIENLLRRKASHSIPA